MGWPFEELIAYASRGTEVRAGDVLGSGTCGNGGCLAELWGRRGRIYPPPLRRSMPRLPVYGGWRGRMVKLLAKQARSAVP